MLAERGLAHQRHAVVLDGVVVVVHRERVHVQVVAQIRDAAAADSGVFLVINHVLVDHRALARRARAALVERPGAAVFEQRVLAAGQHFGDDLVEALLARVINLAHGASQRARHAGAGHQRVERGLARAAFHHALDVAEQHVLGLRREVEDHVHVERREVGAGLADALEDLLAAAVLVVAIHLLQQVVVEALHANAQTLHATLQLVQVAGNQVVRVRLAGHIADAERVARHVDGFAQLVDHDGGRAAAHVQAFEVVAEVLQHEHFLAHVGEVG